MVNNERLLESTDEGGAEIDAEIAFMQVVKAVDDVLDKSHAAGADITQYSHVVPNQPRSPLRTGAE